MALDLKTMYGSLNTDEGRLDHILILKLLPLKKDRRGLERAKKKPTKVGKLESLGGRHESMN